jgi:hypothetical protein
VMRCRSERGCRGEAQRDSKSGTSAAQPSRADPYG